MPTTPRDGKFDTDTEMLIRSLLALGGRKPAKRAPKSAAGSKPTSRPARKRARAA